MKSIEKCKALFLDLDVFFIKVPTHTPHLAWPPISNQLTGFRVHVCGTELSAFTWSGTCRQVPRTRRGSRLAATTWQMETGPGYRSKSNLRAPSQILVSPIICSLHRMVSYSRISLFRGHPGSRKAVQTSWLSSFTSMKYLLTSIRSVNGIFTKQGQVSCSKTSTTSFGERRVPRRGFVQVFPGEHDYEQLAREQGLLHLIPKSPEQPNGTGHINGITPPSSDKSKSINGGSPHQGMSQLPNGIHSDVHMGDVTSAHSP